ncbi:MAG: DUF2946 family protein [Betaproteobacteria bacterium]|nr:DUF2946 family protein [Betaproteobacteria bacterium]
MDEKVRAAVLKWPDVPAVYGWLLLDRRGEWRIRTGSSGPASFERIGNAALRAFISRNFACDERGCWHFQNGPQRVFVRLSYTPRVWHLESKTLRDHCGRAGVSPFEAWLDEEGSLILADRHGVGVLDDRDLALAAEGIRGESISIGGLEARLGRITGSELPQRFGFEREPKP